LRGTSLGTARTATAEPGAGEVPKLVIASPADVVREARRLLREAEVSGRLPTPIEDLVAAAGLTRGSDEIFSDHVLARAPRELQAAVRGLVGKVRAMLDRQEREIYVSPKITLVGRRNFHTLHEVGHERLTWQKQLAYADDEIQLSWKAHMRFEREANQFASEVLFQSDFFTKVASQYAIGMASVVELADMFGSSIHAAFRRFVETHRAALCGVVIECRPAQSDPLAYKRHEALASSSWKSSFADPSTWPHLLQQPAYTFLSVCREAVVVPTAACTEWSLVDNEGRLRELHVEVFSNHYSVFALIWVPRRERLKRHPVIAVPVI
jgi:hypothetical protein